MASLLAKFRIDYSDLMIIPEITKKAGEKSVAFFEELIKDQTVKDDDESGAHSEGNFFLIGWKF